MFQTGHAAIPGNPLGLPLPSPGRRHCTKPAHPPGLTLAGGHRVPQAPFAVGLTADDPLASVVVTRVTDEHQLGLELVLRLKDEPPPAVFHTDAANIRAGHSWGDGAARRLSQLILGDGARVWGWGSVTQ